jgi:hypothetical protein
MSAVSDDGSIKKFVFPQAKKLDFLVIRLAAADQAALLRG